MNLVTGGAGFIGSHLVQQLLTAGETVRVLEHPTAVVSHLPLECIELVQADIRDLDAMRNAARGCERLGAFLRIIFCHDVLPIIK